MLLLSAAAQLSVQIFQFHYFLSIFDSDTRRHDEAGVLQALCLLGVLADGFLTGLSSGSV